MTSTLKDQQQKSPAAAAAVAPPPPPPTGAGGAAPTKHRLSCTACSVPGNHRYAAASQQASPASSRRNSHLKTLTPPSNSNSSQDSLITHKSNANNNISPHSNHNIDHSPPTTSNVASQNLTLDLPSLASSSSSLPASSGFNLKFNTHHSQPRIKCHIDHLDQDLELDVKLDGSDDNNSDMSHMHSNNSTRFTVNCYNPNDPDKQIKLRVELVKTSAKGFGLKIIQHMPRPPSLTNSSDEASLVGKKEKSKRNKGDHSDSRRNSVRSESSRSVPKSNDSSELDEVRFSSGEMSNVGDDSEDHCKCTTPCGAPGCKGTKFFKEQGVNI